MFILIRTAILSLVLAFDAGAAFAQDSDKGADHKGSVADFIAKYIGDFKASAEQGDANAQYLLGEMYREGSGVIQDYAEAAKWYRMAAEQGDANAQYRLSEMYKWSMLGPRDRVRAHMWVNIASANGHKEAGGIRNTLANAMLPNDILKAQSMARECMSSNYKNCGW